MVCYLVKKLKFLTSVEIMEIRVSVFAEKVLKPQYASIVSNKDEIYKTWVENWTIL